MTMLPVKIAGLGAYLPAQRVASDALEAQLGLPPGWIFARTGVCERRIAGPNDTASGMAARAAQIALDRAGLTPSDLDAIIGASSGPQQLIPCNAALVQAQIGAPDGLSACWDINATCLSFPVALHTAAQLIAAGVYRCVLVFSSEIASRSLNPHQPESFVLFGDGAAAAVVTASAPLREPARIEHARFATHSSGADHTRFLGAGSLHSPNDPSTTPAMNQFDMNGPAVFRHAARVIKPFLDDFLALLGASPRDFNAVVPHQASRHALDQLTRRLGFANEQIVMNLATRGNCVAASIPLALCEAVEAGRICRGDRVLLVGTGAGLTLGALALTY